MMMYFSLYSHIVPVSGVSDAVIYDLKNEKLIAIPTFLYKLIDELQTLSVQEIESRFSGTDKVAFDRYLQFLRDKEIGVFAENRLRFERLKLQWFSPGVITVAVVEIDFRLNTNIIDLVCQLSQLLCKSLELRICNAGSHRQMLEAVLDAINKSSICELLLFLEFESGLEEEWLISLKGRLRISSKVYVLNTPASLRFNEGIAFAVAAPALDTLCDSVSSHYIVNMSFFMESQHHHPYFNKRICVDKTGKVKNCLSHIKSFGNVHRNKLTDIIEKTDFKTLWHARPDLIEDIKDAAFRYAVYSNKELVLTPKGFYKYK